MPKVAKPKTSLTMCSFESCNLPAFKTYTERMAHERMVHLGIKRHVCTFCNYVAPQASTLNIHLNKHTGAKPWRCRGSNQSGVNDACDIWFPDPSSRGRHERNIHGKLCQNGESPMSHQCPKCPTIIQRRDAFKKHLIEQHGMVHVTADFIDDCKIARGPNRKRRWRQALPLPNDVTYSSESSASDEEAARGIDALDHASLYRMSPELVDMELPPPSEYVQPVPQGAMGGYFRSPVDGSSAFDYAYYPRPAPSPAYSSSSSSSAHSAMALSSMTYPEIKAHGQAHLLSNTFLAPPPFAHSPIPNFVPEGVHQATQFHALPQVAHFQLQLPTSSPMETSADFTAPQFLASTDYQIHSQAEWTGSMAMTSDWLEDCYKLALPASI